MDIKELCKKSHDHAVEKGFWKESREVGTLLMLIVSELAEALEADRTNKRADNSYILVEPDSDKEDEIVAFEQQIKDTFEDEIADTFIRLADLCEGIGIDIEKFYKMKMKYNKTRQHKHGKSY